MYSSDLNLAALLREARKFPGCHFPSNIFKNKEIKFGDKINDIRSATIPEYSELQQFL